MKRINMFSERLKSLRKKQKLSLQNVADAINVSKTHIWELETKKSDNPTLNTLKKLSELFEVTISYLIGETNDLPKLHSNSIRIAYEVEKIFYKKELHYQRGADHDT